MSATAELDICITRGRCRSGKRWFWVAAELYADVPHKCDDPACVYGGPHEYGWEDTEEAALASMRAAVVRLGGEADPVDWRGLRIAGLGREALPQPSSGSTRPGAEHGRRSREPGQPRRSSTCTSRGR